MHQAGPGVGHHVRLLLAPAGQGVRPFACSAQLVDVPAERNRVAIDQAGDDRRQLPGGHRHHDLVDESQAFPGPALPDECVALLLHGEGDEVSIAEALADRGGLRGGGIRGLVVTGCHVPQDGGRQQVALLDALTPLAVDQPLRATEPSGRAGGLAAEQEVETHPAGAPRGGESSAGIQVSVMGSLEEAQVVVFPAEHVCRGREQLDVRRSKRGRLIGT